MTRCEPTGSVRVESGGDIPRDTPPTNTSPQGLIARLTLPVARTAGAGFKVDLAGGLAALFLAGSRAVSEMGALTGSAGTAARLVAGAAVAVGRVSGVIASGVATAVVLVVTSATGALAITGTGWLVVRNTTGSTKRSYNNNAATALRQTATILLPIIMRRDRSARFSWVSRVDPTRLRTRSSLT